jgi:hypothetical protein
MSLRRRTLWRPSAVCTRVHHCRPFLKGVPFIALNTQTPPGVVNYLFVATSYVGYQDNKRQP